MAGRTSNIDIAQAGDLQTAIQGKLEQHGYSEAGDPVMAEYVTVMLANSKTSEQITAELSELIGPDYEASFTEWIFDSAIPEYYNKNVDGGAGDTSPAAVAALEASSSNAGAAEPTQSQVNSIETVQDSRDNNRGGGFRQGGGGRHDLPNRPNGPPTGPRGGQQQQRGNGVFGSAMNGLKREGDQSIDRPNNRRARLSEPNGEGANGGGDRSIFDRAGVRAGGPPAFGGRRGQQNQMMQQQQQPPMFGGPQFAPQVIPGSVIQSGIPGLPPLHIPHNYNALPPAQQQAIQQQIFQHQLIAAAAANQLFQPQGGPLVQQPQHQQQQPFPVQSAEAHHGFQQAPSAGQQQHQPRKPSKPVRLPDRPSSEELCKYGVDCRNAICKYSHPSPAATKESGLVLSKDVCEKNLECDDKDCPKSHVSPAQKTDPEGKNIHLYTQKGAPAPAPVPVVAPLAAPNPGAKPCMFGANCTRPGCYFSHPPKANATPCRFGIACTRPDCHFSHPPGHKVKTFGSTFSTQKNKSATFGAGAGSNGSAASPTAKEGENLEGKDDVKVEDSKMSARMKRFMENDTSKAGERELIIDGKEVNAGEEQKNGD